MTLSIRNIIFSLNNTTNLANNPEMNILITNKVTEEIREIYRDLLIELFTGFVLYSDLTK